ncbi:stonustoxin subunit beta-like [Pungitius pungitius]|uniref:stonustoxin subunit beta-like n=1 Tax=Pungitius pungitius TaxID=134920 RepID=UPI002E0DA81B
MARVKKDILKMLKQLKEEEFKEFKWHLENEPIPGDPRSVPSSDLQNADRMHYGTDSAQLATAVLVEMQKNDLAEILSNTTTSADSCELTIDTNTVNEELKLSDNNRKVTHVKEVQSHPDHPDRFDYFRNLLCRTGLTGRCHWEVEWIEGVDVSVSYGGIKRKGDSQDCCLGQNDQSWSLWCSDGGYYVCHNKTVTRITSSSSSSGRVAVYVDWPAGSLSFYTVSSDSLIHLHTFSTTFTEPLYPGFCLWSLSGYGSCTGSSVSLCPL